MVLLWILSILVNVGMWLERYVIVVTSLQPRFSPSSWSMYHGTIWDYATYTGHIGLFASLLFLFIRFLPVISIAEMRELVHESREHQAAARCWPTGGRMMSQQPEETSQMYGLMAEFESPKNCSRLRGGLTSTAIG